jgi:hypothetical protein
MRLRKFYRQLRKASKGAVKVYITPQTNIRLKFPDKDRRYCPITAVALIEEGVNLSPGFYRVASYRIGMTSDVADGIVTAADNEPARLTLYRHKQIRRAMLRAVGLNPNS